MKEAQSNMNRNLISVWSVCRICLKDGATLPIFNKKETNQVNILSKISICMNEKIEDIEGYPNNICKECDGMLDTFHSFINKFKQSSKLLAERRLNLDKNYNYNSEKNASITEIDLKDIKKEIDEYKDQYSGEEHSKPINCLELKLPDVKIEKVPKESKQKPVRSKKKVQNASSRIASSILEGEFSWIGDKWCVKANQKVIKKKARVPKKRVREKKLDLPKVTAPTESTLCDICGEVFQSRDKLAIHRKNFHLRTPVQCPKCSRMCASTYYLNRHMKRKHETERDFICNICGKGFVFKGELTSHIKSVHEKDQKPKRIFSCKFCTKTYKCPKSIVVHERSVHTGLRPAVCSECGSSFYHIDYLKEHMRLHTGETPFKCPICGRGYAQLCNMKSHLRIHKISELDATTLNKIRPNYLKLLKP